MCVSCGCGSPEDKHGDDRNITLSELQAAADAFERDASAAQAAAIDHPVFGRLPLADVVRLQEIHTQHHRGQLTPAAV